jgi:tRNA pseudouridine55 synthase
MSRPRSNIKWRQLDGVLLLDKPAGMSSNQALQRVRHLFAAEKGGHTGSLDPLATGMLPLCFGEATKVAGLLLGSRKAYTTTARLGATTDTDDADGEILRKRDVPALDEVAIEAALAPLRGRIVQVPPIYSALKQGGEALYRKARRGEAIEVPGREVEVHRMELLGHAGDELRLLVECGSGTYVRSLVRDLGEALGCGAHVTVLRRLWVEPFQGGAMHSLPELEAAAAGGGVPALDALLLPVEAALPGLPRVLLDEERARRLRQGQTLDVDACPEGLALAVEAGSGHALGLVDGVAGEIRPRRLFRTP